MKKTKLYLIKIPPIHLHITMWHSIPQLITIHQFHDVNYKKNISTLSHKCGIKLHIKFLQHVLTFTKISNKLLMTKKNVTKILIW